MKKLTKKQKEELQKLIDEVIGVAKDVVKDYKLDPAVSGSEGIVIQVHQDSPILSGSKENE
tara:strand:+ start:126 stop:308 length:183 start_codon:yes stop_codon:yes gene_type:complete